MAIKNISHLITVRSMSDYTAELRVEPALNDTEVRILQSRDVPPVLIGVLDVLIQDGKITYKRQWARKGQAELAAWDVGHALLTNLESFGIPAQLEVVTTE